MWTCESCRGAEQQHFLILLCVTLGGANGPTYTRSASLGQTGSATFRVFHGNVSEATGRQSSSPLRLSAHAHIATFAKNKMHAQEGSHGTADSVHTLAQHSRVVARTHNTRTGECISSLKRSGVIDQRLLPSFLFWTSCRDWRKQCSDHGTPGPAQSAHASRRLRVQMIYVRAPVLTRSRGSPRGSNSASATCPRTYP